MEKIRTGLYGGSFNPIHKGHIAIARQMREKAGLEEVWFMVSPQNPLKERGSLLDDTRRMEMARAALRGMAGLKACGYEMSACPCRRTHGARCRLCGATFLKGSSC